jgi:hypothetical protein
MTCIEENYSKNIIEKAFQVKNVFSDYEIKIVHKTKQPEINVKLIREYVLDPKNGFPEAMVSLSNKYLCELCNSSEESANLSGITPQRKRVAKKISKSERVLKFMYDGKEYACDRTTNRVYDSGGCMVGYRRHDDICVKCSSVRQKTDKKNVIYDEHKCWTYIEFL